MFVCGFARRLHRANTPSLLLKLDVEKSFDLIRWDYLLDLLQHHGFPSRLRNRVTTLWATSSSRVFLNGIPSSPIELGRGLQQGDVLCPLLFVIAIDPCNNCLPKPQTKAFSIGCRVVSPPCIALFTPTTHLSSSPP